VNDPGETQEEAKTQDARPAGSIASDSAYPHMWRLVVVSTAAVSLVPLILMTAVNFYQYDRASRSEARQAIRRLTSNNKRSLEFFIEERLSALTYIIHDKSFEELRVEEELDRILKNMKKSLSLGAFVDLGLVDAEGKQLSYVGPYQLRGKDYTDQDWFHDVKRQGVHVSDVFLGYRNSPHFVLAIWHEKADGSSYILRATIDTQMLNEQILTVGLSPNSDCFVVNRDGILQTPSRRYGGVLESCPFDAPPRAHETEVVSWRDEEGKRAILGYAHIDRSPFVLIMLSRPSEVMGGWLNLRTELAVFLALSVILILAVILWGSSKFVNQIRKEDEKRTTLLHKVEYTNKLASLGRLAAGTAHEINNPLAIINEKAGLLKDLVTFEADKPPPAERTLELAESILKAVDRCSTITHRLLGFAKHMDVRNETLDLQSLIRELLAFLEKEIAYRNLQVKIEVSADVPTIESDRGQLQQVLLNLINNAFGAVPDGGEIEISVDRAGPNTIAVSVADNGVGIPKENLGKVFEPFFTTKKGYGTGLGLSVTYGIVQKLGGQISVESELGKETRFTISLPIKKR
jgi:signal transduction histidine kinase